MRSWQIAAVVVIQAFASSPRQLLRVERPLSPQEISVVLNASRDAIAGRTFRLAFPGFVLGPEVLMGKRGRPRIMRLTYGLDGGSVGGDGSRTSWHEDFVDIIEHTGQSPTRCDGAAVSGELVITYQHRASTNRWTATAATTPVAFDGRPALEVGRPIFDMLDGAVPLASQEHKLVDGRPARAFVGSFAPLPGTYGVDNSQAPAAQTLWIDTESLRPLRWEVIVDGAPGYVMVFNYLPLDLGPPNGIERPRCIQ